MDPNLMHRIAMEIAEKHQTTIPILRGLGFRFKLAPARAEFCKRCFEAGKNLSEIGRFLNRDHSSIYYYLRREN